MPGELHVGGVGVARGYLNQPDLTAERFLPDPFTPSPDAQMFRTGDLARWLPDGNLEYLGRTDFQVKLRGFRIELGEIEAALTHLPAIREAAVLVSVEAPGEPRLVAYLVPAAPSSPLDPADLRAALRQSLPGHMIPAAFVTLASLPLTPNSKLDRTALPSPEPRHFLAAAYEPAIGELEEELAKAWSEILHTERIGRHDNFFDLGGHSLLVTRAMAPFRKDGLAMVDFFRYPTISGLAALLSKKRSIGNKDCLVTIRGEGTDLPLFIIHDGEGELTYGYMLGKDLAGNYPIYGIPLSPNGAISLESVHAIASRFVTLIKDTQPSGPYRILGWSTGGILAYETAIQLMGEDLPVSYLGILDANYCPAVGGRLSWAVMDDLEMLLSDISEIIKTNQFDQGHLDSLRTFTDFDGLVDFCNSKSLLSAKFTNDELRHHYSIRRSMSKACCGYFADQIHIPVHLYQAQEGIVGSGIGPMWKNLVGETNLQVHLVPGNHHSMLQSNNLKNLARHISCDMDSLDLPLSRNFPPPQAPIFMLQSGKYKEPCLLCFPGAGAGALTFTDLITNMDPTISVLAYQPRGLDGLHLPHTKVETIVDWILRSTEIDLMKKPIHLLGHSFGGWVAFELAIRAQSLGIEIATLTLLDSDAPTPASTLDPKFPSHQDLLNSWIEVFELTLEHPIGLKGSDLASLPESSQLKLIHEKLVDFHLLPRRSSPDSLRGPLHAFAAALRCQYYPANPFRGTLHLGFVGNATALTSSSPFTASDMTEGWNGLAERVVKFMTPGNHITTLKEPYVKVFASYINSILHK